MGDGSMIVAAVMAGTLLGFVVRWIGMVGGLGND